MLFMLWSELWCSLTMNVGRRTGYQTLNVVTSHFNENCLSGAGAKMISNFQVCFVVVHLAVHWHVSPPGPANVLPLGPCFTL